MKVGVGEAEPAVYLLSLMSVCMALMSSIIMLNWWMRRTRAMSTCWLMDWQEMVKLQWKVL